MHSQGSFGKKSLITESLGFYAGHAHSPAEASQPQLTHVAPETGFGPSRQLLQVSDSILLRSRLIYNQKLIISHGHSIGFLNFLF